MERGCGGAVRGVVHTTLRQTIENVEVGDHGDHREVARGRQVRQVRQVREVGGEDQRVGTNTLTPTSETIQLSVRLALRVMNEDIYNSTTFISIIFK